MGVNPFVRKHSPGDGSLTKGPNADEPDKAEFLDLPRVQ